jgi:hypothetical protein
MISDIDGMSQIYRADCSTRFARSALIASLAPRGSRASCGRIVDCSHQEDQMAKSARKRRARRKKSANHGKRPNA